MAVFIETFLEGNINIMMPTLLVAAAFFLKAFKRTPLEWVDVVLTLLELPMDIIILALGFISSYIIAIPENAVSGLTLFVLGIVLSIPTFGFSQSAVSFFLTKDRPILDTIKCIVYGLLAYVISGCAYYISIVTYGGV